jgi:hypothetical protein
MVDCMIHQNPLLVAAEPLATSPTCPPSPTTSAVSNTGTLFLLYSNNLQAFTAVMLSLISQFEMDFYHHDISGSPPLLLWRSDLKDSHFPVPALGTRFFSIPVKTARGVIGMPLNAVWLAVAPAIVAHLKSCGMRYLAVQPVCFCILEDNMDRYLGPAVVWITVPVKFNNARAVCGAAPNILHILANLQITNVVVKWYQADIKKFIGPPLMSIEDQTSARFGLGHPFNVGLGVPTARQCRALLPSSFMRSRPRMAR